MNDFSVYARLGASEPRHCASTRYPWSVAIFAARETPEELLATIDAIAQAATEPTVIDVMVNGNPGLAAEITALSATMSPPEDSVCLRVWSLALGGKAHAWNQYLHFVWPGTETAFFVDGYARPRPDAFRLLAAAMSSAPRSLAGTGIPSSGKSAQRAREELLRDGGLQGNFFAIKQSAMHALRDSNFELPLGLYGFDSLLGAVLAFGLDPSKHPWSVKEFILVHPDVTWTVDEKKWWRYSTVKTHFKRILNNALRVLVVQATKNFLAQRKLPPEQLPRTVEDFVLDWVKRCPDEARKTLWKSPLCRLALAKLREPRDWSAAEQAPAMLYASSSAT